MENIKLNRKIINFNRCRYRQSISHNRLSPSSRHDELLPCKPPSCSVKESLTTRYQTQYCSAPLQTRLLLHWHYSAPPCHFFALPRVTYCHRRCTTAQKNS